MQGIKELKYNELIRVMQKLEILFANQAQHAAAQELHEHREAISSLYQNYRDLLSQLDNIIHEYEQQTRNIRSIYLAKPLRKLRKQEETDEIKQLVYRINALAK